MKLNYFYWVASLALFMAGCTTNEEGEDNGPQGSKKEAYTSVTIKLPALNGTKAAPAEPGYDNGTEGEYKVKDLTLLFFRTANESDKPESVAEGDFVLSEVVSTIPELSTGSVLPASILSTNTNGTTGAVTKIVTTGPISIDSRSIRVLALLNVGSTTDIAKNLLKIGYSFKTINAALPLPGDINTLLGGDTKDCFMMTSAPVYTTPSMTTLTVCEPKPSEQSAKDNPVSINVERVVAKVQLKAKADSYQDESGTYYFTVADGSHNGDKITILDWTLGNTNTYAYPFRVVNGDWASSGSDIWTNAICPSSSSQKARIHWAVDPNYTQGAYNPSPFATPTTIAKAEVNNDWPGKSEYCLENTCDYLYMNKSVVTRLIVKAKYVPNSKNQDGGNNTTDNDGTWWSFTSVAAHYSAQNMYKKIIDWVKESLSSIHTDMPNAPKDTDINIGITGLTATEKNNNWEVSLEADGDSHYKLVKVIYKSTTGGTGNVTLNEAALEGFQSSMGKIQKYDQGFCYYEIFIRHFTDEEGGYAPADGTPWVKEGDYTQAQLGRYGVVRNNWYTVTINSIKQPGEPTIPVDPDEPVDTQTAYINCSIEISAWAKREHDIDL